MGTIHKFERPPKNENQFKGYQPFGRPIGLVTPKRRLRPWQKLWLRHKGLLTWTLLIAIATAIVGVRAVFKAFG